ncbi:MAG: galactokinase [Chloroflexota bacterium]|nr:galactokinase [Chloroflexota bacterium]
MSAGARPTGRETIEPVDSERLRAALAEREPAAVRAASSVRVVRAPGRVNLIGEHTDYNEGFVLPVAIDLEIRIALVPTDDRRVELTLLDGGERDGFGLDSIPPKSGSWIDYVAATAWSLADEGLRLRGFRGVIGSNLPMSSGLSSSAALELASAWALLDPPDPTAQGIDRMTLARLAQRGENEYVGVKSGLMDQFASSLGRARAAMLLDCRSLDHRAVGLPLAHHRLIVCDSGSPRRLDASEYNARRAECEEAVRIIAQRNPSVRSLRDVDLDLLIGARFALDERIFRRAEHIVRENERVLATVDALESGDLAEVGRLWAQSHASLRDLFEVSSPELDALVEIATAVPGVAAARMTGAGFGGCTVNLVARDSVDGLREAIDREYHSRTGRRARVLAVEPADGAGHVQ